MQHFASIFLYNEDLYIGKNSTAADPDPTLVVLHQSICVRYAKKSRGTSLGLSCRHIFNQIFRKMLRSAYKNNETEFYSGPHKNNERNYFTEFFTIKIRIILLKSSIHKKWIISHNDTNYDFLITNYSSRIVFPNDCGP
jgi:hypothetical protein